jgi:hypothetical protein
MSIAAVPKCRMLLITLAVVPTVACSAGSTTSSAIGSSGRAQAPTDASMTYESRPPQPTDDGSGSMTTTAASTGTNDTALVGFSLDLVGPVAFADRYSVHLSVDDTVYDKGFCGFDGESTRCLASEFYACNLPAVPLGSTLDRYYTRRGSESFEFAAVSNRALSAGLQVAARCIYTDSSSRPTCERTA